MRTLACIVRVGVQLAMAIVIVGVGKRPTSQLTGAGGTHIREESQ